MQQGNTAMWLLGALASLVATQYGKSRLQQYADDIGANYQALKRARTTFAAWQGNDEKGPHGPFSVCRALAAVPNRAALLAANPEMTEREALAHARAYRQQHQRQRPRGCALHQLYAQLQQPKLLQLIDETIAHRDEEYGPLRLQAATHCEFVIDRLRELVAALKDEGRK